MIFLQEKRNLAPHGGACVCGVAEYPATKTFFRCSRGAVDRHHSLPNEDSDGLIVKSGRDAFWTYLQFEKVVMLRTSFRSPPEPLLLPCFPVEVTTGKPSDQQADGVCSQLYSRLISCTRDSSVVLERLALSIWSSSVCAEWQNTLSPQLVEGGWSRPGGLQPTKTPPRRHLRCPGRRAHPKQRSPFYPFLQNQLNPSCTRDSPVVLER